jgi:hypothetical protein
VASKPWSYDALRATWTGCPSAEAQVSRTAYQDDTGACSNTEDSLVISWGAEGSLGNGMKVWNDCGGTCGGQTRFGAGCSAGPTLCTTALLVTSKTGLVSAAGNCGVVQYACASGYDNIWLR